jgi:hypothetical protein
MTNDEFQQLQQNDIVRRSKNDHGSGNVDGRVYSVDHTSGKVRVNWIEGVRKGTRTTLHYSNLRFISKAITHLTVEQIDAIAAKPYSREYTEAMRSPSIRLGQKIEIRSKSGRTWPRFTDSGEPIGLPDDVPDDQKRPYKF